MLPARAHHSKLDILAALFPGFLMMRNVLCLLTAVLFPSLAWAQDAKPVPLVDYVSFCLALWDGSPDLQAKASALGVHDVTGSAGASMTVGKSTMRFYKSAEGSRTVGATSTTFADGKDSSCDINLHAAVERADLDAMEKAIDLDGQIMTLGPTMMGRWKMRKRQPVMLLKAIASKTFTILMVQKFEAAPAVARAKQTH
jgi:hypothetical protein